MEWAQVASSDNIYALAAFAALLAAGLISFLWTRRVHECKVCGGTVTIGYQCVMSKLKKSFRV